MKIDGFVPVDNKIAFREGTTFSYPTKYGDIVIIAKMAGDGNEAFTEGFAKLSQRHAREEALGALKPEKSMRDIITLFAEEVVIRWSTTIKSDEKPIEPTQENFVELMSSPALRGVFLMFQRDCTDLEHFRAKHEEKIIKN